MNREEAIADLITLKEFFEERSNATPVCLEYAISELERIPERKKGKWMHDKDDGLYSGYCSCCGWMSVVMETDVADMPFCPNCGADMREEE